MSRGLPYGRGYVQDPVAQKQEWARRSRENPSQDGWFFASNSHPVYNTQQLGTPTLDQLCFVPLPIFDKDYHIVEAHTTVTAAGTTSTVKCGLYTISSIGELLLLPGSSTTFDTTSTGGLKEDCKCSLYAGNQYFWGYYGEGAAGGTMVTSMNDHSIPLMTINSFGSLPTRVARGILSRDNTFIFPVIGYKSKFANKYWLGY